MANVCEYMRQIILVLIVTGGGFIAAACGSKTDGDAAHLVVVTAPAAGEIRRVLVREGAPINVNATIVEIAPPTANQPAAPTAANSAAPPNAQNDARQTVQAAEKELTRAAIAVSRMESLVASNSAPQAQLDAARADFERAQKRLQQIRAAAQSAQTAAILRRGADAVPAAAATPPEKIIPVPAPTNGILSVISVRAAQKVRAGEPIATISTKTR